jgi:hypothetical protein
MDVSTIWIIPAFTITAAIIVMLDLLHQPTSNPGIAEHQKLVEIAAASLSSNADNGMAVRGAKILEIIQRVLMMSLRLFGLGVRASRSLRFTFQRKAIVALRIVR